MPSLGRELSFSPESLSWVVNAYMLLFGGFLLLGGRLTDLLGARRLFIGGLALFTIASMAGGFAQDAVWMVIARGGQGLGAAVVSPAALALVLRTFTVN